MAPALSSRAAPSGAAVEPAGRIPPSCVRQATPSSMPRLFGLSPIGIGALLEAGGYSGLGFGGLGFASLGHAQEPGINGPTSREVHVDHVAAVGALGGLFHARSIDPARFTVTRNQNQNKSSTEGGSRLG